MREQTQEQWIQNKAEELCVDAGYSIHMAELFIPDASRVFVNMMLDAGEEKEDVQVGN